MASLVLYNIESKCEYFEGNFENAFIFVYKNYVFFLLLPNYSKEYRIPLYGIVFRV